MDSDTPSSSRVKFGALSIDPARNPAVIDTGTWDPGAAVTVLTASPVEPLRELCEAIRDERPLPMMSAITPYEGSIARKEASAFALAGLVDGQHVLLEFHGRGEPRQFPGGLADVGLTDDWAMTIHPTDTATLHRYLREIAPTKGPRALGDTPRLGVGNRMSKAGWPAVFRAMESHGFAANAIQNSIRELNLLSDLVEGRPAEKSYYPGFGMIEAGHTGSTTVGLWVCGVLEALKYPTALRFGADADHLPVRRGPDGLSRANRYLEACRYYTFFTIDLSDILDYAALREPSDPDAASRAEAAIGDPTLHRQMVAYHKGPKRVGSQSYQLSEALIDRMVGKYWQALAALEEVDTHLRRIKEGEPYDLEFTMDEHPPEVPAFDCLTSAEECLFVAGELRRRAVPVTHLAPNVGIEKGFDYRGPDGLEGFERRVATLGEITAAHDLLIDIHSADDLSAPTRGAIRRATGGRLHYKVSPMPQVLFAGVLEDFDPGLFREWWNDAVTYAREEAAAGSPFASWCLEQLGPAGPRRPSHRDSVFHHYGFRFVGRRDAQGQFLHRERLYSLPKDFYQAYENRVVAYLAGLADELLA
jgi:hypothetical protein